MASLTGKWSLVTGASRGVGVHLAEGLAGLGSNLILHSRDLAHTAAMADRLRGTGVQVVTVAAELAQEAQVEAMLDLVQQTADVDIVYNNAAIMTPYRNDYWDVPAEDMRQSFEVNVIALARICYRLIPSMLARKWGRVINVSSGIRNEPELAAYAMSKAAVDKFVKDFVPKLAGTGVTMNLLDPGWLRTDLGGPRAPGEPSSVIPGALIPALMNDGKSGLLFGAQDYAGLSVDAALAKAQIA